MKYIRRNWPILLILVLALFLRLYRINSTMTFLEDEGRDLLVVKRMLDTKRPVLIGPQTSTGNMYLGPLYYYLITPALLLSRMDPVGPAIFIALTGVATVYYLYLIAKRWFGRTPALLSSALYAVLPMVISFTRNSWNPNLVPFIVVLILHILDYLVLRRLEASRKHWLYLGLLLGLLVQLHYMALVFVGFVGIAILFSYFRDLGKLTKGLLYSLIGFFAMLSPFILFEFRNQFVNTHAIQKLLIASDDHTIRYSLPLWLYRDKVLLTMRTVFGNLLGRSFFIKDTLMGTLTTIFFLLTLATFFLRRSKLVIFLLLAPLFFLGIYQENIHPHYLSFLFPLVPLVFAAGLSSRFLKPFAFAFTLFVISWTFPTTLSYIHSGPTNQANKAKLVARYIAESAGTEPYNVISRGGTFTTPYLYYLALADNPPTIEQASRAFLICQDTPCEESNITTTLLYLDGPSHPTLTKYLGHPAINEFTIPRTMLSNEHVEGGVWVAEIIFPGIIEP